MTTNDNIKSRPAEVNAADASASKLLSKAKFTPAALETEWRVTDDYK